MDIKANSKNMLFLGLSSSVRLLEMSDGNLSYRTPGEKVFRLALDMLRDAVKGQNGTMQFNFIPFRYGMRYMEGVENLQLPTPQKTFNIERNKSERATFILENFNDLMLPRISKYIQDDDIVIITGYDQVEALRDALVKWKETFDKYHRNREKIAELEAKKKGCFDVDEVKCINASIKEYESYTLIRPSFQSLAREISYSTRAFSDGVSAFFRTLKPVMFLKDNVDIGIFRVCKEKYSHTPSAEEILSWVDVVEESGKILQDRFEIQRAILADEKTPANLKEFASMKIKAYDAMADIADLVEKLGEDWRVRLETVFNRYLSDQDVIRQIRCIFALLEFMYPISSLKFKVRGLEPNMKLPYSLSELYTMEYEPLISSPELEVVAASVIDSGLKPFVAPNPYTTAAMLASGLLEKSHTSEISEVERDNIELEDIGTGDAGILRFFMMKTENKVETATYLPTGEQILTEETKRSYVPVCSVFVPIRLELDVFNVQQN